MEYFDTVYKTCTIKFLNRLNAVTEQVGSPEAQEETEAEADDAVTGNFVFVGQ